LFDLDAGAGDVDVLPRAGSADLAVLRDEPDARHDLLEAAFDIAMMADKKVVGIGAGLGAEQVEHAHLVDLKHRVVIEAALAQRLEPHRNFNVDGPQVIVGVEIAELAEPCGEDERVADILERPACGRGARRQRHARDLKFMQVRALRHPWNGLDIGGGRAAEDRFQRRLYVAVTDFGVDVVLAAPIRHCGHGGERSDALITHSVCASYFVMVSMW
jgi:hypothetical protein